MSRAEQQIERKKKFQFNKHSSTLIESLESSINCNFMFVRMIHEKFKLLILREFLGEFPSLYDKWKHWVVWKGQ